ncbi:MAG: LLM class flavin-dependent oxidoreductase [Deltaproteobacteria bacterium]|nr:LLM class flavin-dependent oxidoreductase [Deltaproteobacteria bacterium]
METKKKLKFWGTVLPLPAAMLAETARQCEQMGLEGVWAPQLWGPPFLPLAAAAMATSRIKLGSGVALAFPRTPLETACAALDLDRISGGRTVLGIGPAVRAWNEDWHGVHYGKPIPHLRECVEITRRIIRQGHTGELGRWEGQYYKLDLSEFRTLAPPVRADIPIYIPAVFEAACRLAGEIADGLPGHPIWCEQWITERVVANLAKGLARGGRDRKNFDLNVWLFVAPGRDRRECIEDMRPTIVFYAKFAQYERYFAECGFGSEARAIQRACEAGDEAGMRRACTDAMVEKFALVGAIDDIRGAVQRISRFADSFSLVGPFYGVPVEKFAFYNRRIAEALYG